MAGRSAPNELRQSIRTTRCPSHFSGPSFHLSLSSSSATFYLSLLTDGARRRGSASLLTKEEITPGVRCPGGRPLDSRLLLRQAGRWVSWLQRKGRRAMGEILPITAGVVVGLICWRIASVRLRTAALVVLSVIFGTLASAINGELALTWAFLLIDIPLVFLVAVGTSILLTRFVKARQVVRR